ncbi:hypothetical protein [Methylococcus sp. EFPC2]|uniref:hypothetical protein n=1 Tax=Methylococcus sp. EFPC2 TaxID=2812648 RepID=UPI001967614B|nr:hypothetical protein [Methylococcus sp. EFPC2]QSA98385.1 hypothetical protein JWZ97_06145 [Methylococcus sp. EFPC2]
MSGGRFYSASWHRVAAFKPRLAEHVRIHRHRYRGAIWHVVDDRNTGRVHRFTPAAYLFIRMMDGQRSVDDIWKKAGAVLGPDAPGQEEVIQLLGQLHANDLLKGDVIPDTAELFTRFDQRSRSVWLSNLKNPLAIRLPVWDPDAFLKRTLPYVRPLFGWAGLLLWLMVVGLGITLAAHHWPELSENVSDRMMAARNLVILWLTFPLIKLFHELGHAYAARIQGGEVHEMGIMLLALMVVPYVDASSSAGFRGKWQRALVGSAGMLVEVFIASLAMILWVLVAQGNLRAILFDIMMIAGVSTLVFNGNPLLRYDGYYMLSDLIETPNLALRANRYWLSLINRHLFRIKNPAPLDATPGECRWFLFYAPAALAYRFVVMFGIAIFLANSFFVIGVALALWSAASLLVIPLVKGLHYVLHDPRLQASRRRAVGVTLGLAGALALFISVIPMPLRTQSEGVVWLPEQAEARAGTAGFVHRVLVKAGSRVEVGDPLVECEDPVLEAEIRLARARVAEIGTRRAAEWVEDKVKAGITRQELEREQANLARAEEKARNLLIRSKARGYFMLAKEDDLPGRFLKQGELVGYVVDGSLPLVRVVVGQDDIDLVRRGTRAVAVRFADRPGDVLPARLIREVPAARAELPSPALSTEGGGQNVLDPRDPEKTRALTSLFQFDLALAGLPPATGANAVPPYGGRVHVRFEHNPEPWASQGWRRLRQLFLSRMNV